MCTVCLHYVLLVVFVFIVVLDVVLVTAVHSPKSSRFQVAREKI